MATKFSKEEEEIFYSHSSSDSETSDVEDTSYNNYSARIGGPCAVSRDVFFVCICMWRLYL